MRRLIRRALMVGAAALVFRAALRARRRAAFVARARALLSPLELVTAAEEVVADAPRGPECALALGRDRLLVVCARGEESIPRAEIRRAEFVYTAHDRGYPAGLLRLHLAASRDRWFRLAGDPHPWLDRLDRHDRRGGPSPRRLRRHP